MHSEGKKSHVRIVSGARGFLARLEKKRRVTLATAVAHEADVEAINLVRSIRVSLR